MRVEGMSFCQKKDLLKLRLFCLWRSSHFGGACWILGRAVTLLTEEFARLAQVLGLQPVVRQALVTVGLRLELMAGLKLKLKIGLAYLLRVMHLSGWIKVFVTTIVCLVAGVQVIG
jgi:hypothetical protein